MEWFCTLSYDLLVWFINNYCDARTTFQFLSTCHRLRNSMYQTAVFRRWLAYGKKPPVSIMLKFGSCVACGFQRHPHDHLCPFFEIGCDVPGCRKHRRIFLEQACEVCNCDFFHCPLSNTLVRCNKHQVYNCFGCGDLIDPADAMSRMHKCLTIENRFSRLLNMRIFRKEGTNILFGKNKSIMYVYLQDAPHVPSLKHFGQCNTFRIFIYDAEVQAATCWFEYDMKQQECTCFLKNIIGIDAEKYCSQCMASGECDCDNRQPLQKTVWKWDLAPAGSRATIFSL